MAKHYVGVEKIAETLSVKVGWVYKAAANGTIPSLKCGKYRRFDTEAVIDALSDDNDDCVA